MAHLASPVRHRAFDGRERLSRLPPRPKPITHTKQRGGKFVEPMEPKELHSLIDAGYERENVLHLYSDKFIGGDRHYFHEYVFHNKHKELLKRVFGVGGYSVDPSAASRRVDSSADGGGWMPPLGTHVDACFHGFQFIVNFWVPFQACGIDTPSLGVACADFDEVIEFSGYTGRPDVSEKAEIWAKFEYFDKIMRGLFFWDQEALKCFRAKFVGKIWTPTFDVGDAMMLTNWTLHFTHATPDMKQQRRSNVELRFSSPASLEAVRDLHGAASDAEASRPVRMSTGLTKTGWMLRSVSRLWAVPLSTRRALGQARPAS